MNRRGQDAAAQDRRQKALDLRIAGARYRQIGQQLGVSHVQAFRDVQAALAEAAHLQRHKAEALRELEVARLDRMTLALHSHVQKGDWKSITTAVRVSERRCKLLGLDPVTRIDMTTQEIPPLVIDRVTTRAEMLAALGTGDPEAGGDDDDAVDD